MTKNSALGIASLEPYDKSSGDLQVVIETPRGVRNKYSFDEEKQVFKLGGVMPLGTNFPFDFGFIPQTLGSDGDPLDVLVLMDEPAFTGCLVLARLIGVIEANQTEDGKTNRNDRLIAVACKSIIYEEIKSLDDLTERLIEQIEHFFISYNEAKGKQFEPLGRFGIERAEELIQDGVKKYRAKKRRSTKSKVAKK